MSEASNIKSRARAGAVAGLVGMGCNLLLFGAKLAVGAAAHSIAVTADMLNIPHKVGTKYFPNNANTPDVPKSITSLFIIIKNLNKPTIYIIQYHRTNTLITATDKKYRTR